MTAKDIIQQGELAKYIITSNRADFDLEECDFSIELLYGMMGKKIVIPKSEVLEGFNGQMVFSFDTSDMTGKVTARTIIQIPDSDTSTMYRQEVDEQVIAFVVPVPCPQFLTCSCSTESHDITFERTEDSEIVDAYQELYVTDIITPEVGEPYPEYRQVFTVDGDAVLVHRLSILNQ